MKTFLLLLCGILLVVGCAQQTPELPGSPEITVGELQKHIKYLSSDELGGRRAGERGNRLAAEYIAHEYERYGLLPAGDNGTYFQEFEFVSSVNEGKQSSLAAETGTEKIDFKLDRDFRPLSFSADTSASGPLVFAGYGISADSLHYDDYNGIDVSHKIVLVLRYSPDGKGPQSKFTRFSSLSAKTFVARDKGASAIIFVSGPLDDSLGTLASFRSTMQTSSGIPVLTMSWTSADTLFNEAGKKLALLQQQINSTKTPKSFEFKDVSVSMRAEVIKTRAKTSNVLAYLEGADPVLRKQVLILGAHFDHLGLGGEGSGSLAPDTVAIHHGADDNASGSAGLLELAQYFSANRSICRRSILFTSFSGEELGLLGSGYYVEHPFLPLENTIAMLNMDMIGRLKDSVLVVGGIGTSPEWEKLIRHEDLDLSFHLKIDSSGFGPSDHASFYGKNLPVLFFFTNPHADYHKPSDTWEKINYPGEQKVVDYASRIATYLLNDSSKPAFTKVVASAGQMGGDRSGITVTLGIMPDYVEDAGGMKVASVRPGGPAAKAGLQSSDIIIKFGGKEIKNIYDYMYVLGIHKAGDAVDVVVKRGEKELTFNAVLEARK